MTTPDAQWQREGPALVDQLARALLLDLCAWLGAWPGPVPAEVPYGAAAIRGVEGGRARLAHYLAPELLRRWDASLSPLVAGGQTVDVHLGSLTFEPTAPDAGRVAFTDITGGADRRWRLEVRIDRGHGLIRDAWFTRVEA